MKATASSRYTTASTAATWLSIVSAPSDFLRHGDKGAIQFLFKHSRKPLRDVFVSEEFARGVDELQFIARNPESKGDLLLFAWGFLCHARRLR